MFNRIVLSLVVLLGLTHNFASAGEVVRGRHFCFELPERWNASETISGVSLYAPDGVTSASSIGLRGTPGQTTPEAFVVRTMQLCGATNVRMLQRNPAPFVAGCTGIELFFSYTDKNGVNCMGWSACWISSNFGTYDAIFQFGGTPVDQWQANAALVKGLAARVSVIPGSGAFGGHHHCR